MVPIHRLHIRRDAQTTTPTTVPAYEAPVIAEIFGEDNVKNDAGKLVYGEDGTGLGDPVGEWRESSDEYERMKSKYRPNEKGESPVDKVYRGASEVRSVVAKVRIKEAKKASKE